MAQNANDKKAEAGINKVDIKGASAVAFATQQDRLNYYKSKCGQAAAVQSLSPTTELFKDWNEVMRLISTKKQKLRILTDAQIYKTVAGIEVDNMSYENLILSLPLSIIHKGIPALTATNELDGKWKALYDAFGLSQLRIDFAETLKTAAPKGLLGDDVPGSAKYHLGDATKTHSDMNNPLINSENTRNCVIILMLLSIRGTIKPSHADLLTRRRGDIVDTLSSMMTMTKTEIEAIINNFVAIYRPRGVTQPILLVILAKIMMKIDTLLSPMFRYSFLTHIAYAYASIIALLAQYAALKGCIVDKICMYALRFSKQRTELNEIAMWLSLSTEYYNVNSATLPLDLMPYMTLTMEESTNTTYKAFPLMTAFLCAGMPATLTNTTIVTPNQTRSSATTGIKIARTFAMFDAFEDGSEVYTDTTQTIYTNGAEMPSMFKDDLQINTTLETIIETFDPEHHDVARIAGQDFLDNQKVKQNSVLVAALADHLAQRSSNWAMSTAESACLTRLINIQDTVAVKRVELIPSSKGQEQEFTSDYQYASPGVMVSLLKGLTEVDLRDLTLAAKTALHSTYAEMINTINQCVKAAQADPLGNADVKRRLEDNAKIISKTLTLIEATFDDSD